MTGLPIGITVAVGIGDHFSDSLGAGVVTGGRGVCTLDSAARCVARDTDAIEPDARSSDVYQGAYARYRALFDALRPMFNGSRP
jgi:sugar (pentulose or hexulose) kinase